MLCDIIGNHNPYLTNFEVMHLNWIVWNKIVCRVFLSTKAFFISSGAWIIQPFHQVYRHVFQLTCVLHLEPESIWVLETLTILGSCHFFSSHLWARFGIFDQIGINLAISNAFDPLFFHMSTGKTRLLNFSKSDTHYPYFFPLLTTDPYFSYPYIS